LIHNTFRRCPFCGHSSQTLDFSGLDGVGRRAINKVIHTNIGLTSKLFQIKDLSAVCETQLNFIG
jgi:hypothetical protein